MIQHYFILQWRMLNRKLIEFGIQPILVYVLATICFIGFSFILFEKTDWAHWIYPGFALMSTIGFTELRRNQFLRSTFYDRTYFQIRLLENLVITVPFALFLLYKSAIFISLALILLSFLVVFLESKTGMNIVLPTPFGKRPFEFAVGFRNYVLLILLIYFISFMGLKIQNFNLNMFGLVMIFVCCILFYNKQEDKYFVWIHEHDSTQFLMHKAGIALYHALILGAPLFLLMSFRYPDLVYVIVLVSFIGLLNVLNMLFAKYAAYPRELSLPQGLLLIAAFFFPPILIFTLYYFFNLAKIKLNPILS